MSASFATFQYAAAAAVLVRRVGLREEAKLIRQQRQKKVQKLAELSRYSSWLRVFLHASLKSTLYFRGTLCAR